VEDRGATMKPRSRLWGHRLPATFARPLRVVLSLVDVAVLSCGIQGVAVVHVRPEDEAACACNE